MLQIEFWQLVGFGFTLLSGFFAIIVGAGKMISGQFEKRLDARFENLESARRKEVDLVARLEREMLEMKAELPTQYVRREDYVRGQSVVEAKLDALASKLESVLISVAQVSATTPRKGAKHHGH